MNNNSVLLSVIVPVYQARDYIVECIDSVLNQSYKNLEIIMVDDGSNDGSELICDEIAKKNEKVKVVHSENQGIFQARKLGMSYANGDLITFLDSDDWIDSNAYEDLISIYIKYNPDMITFTYRINEDGKITNHEYEEGFYDRKKIEENILTGMMYDLQFAKRRLDPSVCCKIFKRKKVLEIINKINDRISLGEDALLTYPVVLNADSIYISNTCYYHYRINDNSCTRSLPYDCSLDVKKFQDNIKSFFKDYNNKYNFAFQIDCYVRHFVEMMVNKWYEINCSNVIYLFPYEKIPAYSTVAIYGAGLVGKSYVYQIKRNNYVQITGWFDKNSESIIEFFGERIKAPNEIVNDGAKYCLIAVLNEKKANEIKKDLIELGVPNEKIIWKKPIKV